LASLFLQSVDLRRSQRRPRGCRRAGAPPERSRILGGSGPRPTGRPRADLARQRRQHVPALRAPPRSLLAPGAPWLDRVRHVLLASPRLNRCQHRDVEGRDVLGLPEEGGIAPLRPLGHEEPRRPPRAAIAPRSSTRPRSRPGYASGMPARAGCRSPPGRPSNTAILPSCRQGTSHRPNTRSWTAAAWTPRSRASNDRANAFLPKNS